MKRFVLLMVLAVAVVMGAEAQNRSVNFEQTKEWKKVVRKAKKEKKLIFIDCYTSWCSPCKELLKKVFTQDAVADFFNENFVNVKYDMEKDADGVMLLEKFGVDIFPTLLFVDPVTQEAVHRMVGNKGAEWLIAGGKQAKEPENNLSGLVKRYAAGERNMAFLSAYASTLSSAAMEKEVDEVTAAYLDTMSVEKLATKENWDFVNKYVDDPLSAPLKLVMANREKFYVVAGKEVVDAKLAKSIDIAVKNLILWSPGWGTAFDEKRNEELTDYLLNIDFEKVPAALANLYTAAYVRKGDFCGLLDKMKEVMSYNMLRGEDKCFYFQAYIAALAKCSDKALVEEGIQWIDRVCIATEDYSEKASLMLTKGYLQNSIGDTLGADKSWEEREKYFQESQAKTGGK